MLPSPSPQFTATEMWGPVVAWCALELLAESIDAQNPDRVALDIFDRLRLREPFAQAFTALGFEGEEAWRVAARIKVVLLAGAGAGKEEEPAEAAPLTTAAKATETGVEAPPPAASPASPEAAPEERVALSASLWLDPDVRWLTGVHHAGGHTYLVRESYEELLWWLLMPSLLRLAGEGAPSRKDVEALSRTVQEALDSAEAAGYRVDLLLGTATGEAAEDESVDEAEPETGLEPPAEPEIEILPSQPEEPATELEIEAPAAEEPASPAEPA
jgi:hypothetical protein